MISESVHNIVTHTMLGDAQALQSALDSALREKINAALEEKKQQISKNLVGLGNVDESEEGLDEMDRKTKRTMNQSIKTTAKEPTMSSKHLVGIKKMTDKQHNSSNIAKYKQLRKD